MTVRPDKQQNGGVFRYNICNGLSNQLLYHSGSIAIAHAQGFKEVEIPDHYIIQGSQTSDANVLPTVSNSVPFGFAFDQDHFLMQLKQNLGMTGRFVRFEKGVEGPTCQGMKTVQTANPQTLKVVLNSFRPSPQHMVPLIDLMSNQLPNSEKENGVCVHHRDGSDWHEHCKRWGNNRPGPNYRGNCLTVKGQSFVEAIKARGLATSNHNHQLEKSQRWIYYCGDHEIPQDLLALATDSPTQPSISAISSRRDLLNHAELGPKIQSLLAQQQTLLAEQYNLRLDLLQARDLWALVDFYLCQQLPRFVGNSVSTFSALQIALHPKSYWYNSQFIPLGTMWKVYPIPILYSYSETESSAVDKESLKTSIQSARKHLPSHNPIHLLYHGFDDQEFRGWLQDQNVTRHDYQPSAKFVKKGSMGLRHWLWVDIPMYIESEYLLVLDETTLVTKPFTLADFGRDLTYSVSTRSSLDGAVALLNVPLLRQTHEKFVSFVLQQLPKETQEGRASVRIHKLYHSFYASTWKELPKKTTSLFKHLDLVESIRFATTETALDTSTNKTRYVGSRPEGHWDSKAIQNVSEKISSTPLFNAAPNQQVNADLQAQMIPQVYFPLANGWLELMCLFVASVIISVCLLCSRRGNTRRVLNGVLVAVVFLTMVNYIQGFHTTASV